MRSASLLMAARPADDQLSQGRSLGRIAISDGSQRRWMVGGSLVVS